MGHEHAAATAGTGGVGGAAVADRGLSRPPGATTVRRVTLTRLEVITLGLLATGDRTGYDIRKWFDQYGSFVGYAAQTSQIYRQLRRLVDDGWAVVGEDQRSGGPDAKPYSLTAEGRGRLDDWVASPYVPARRPLDPDLQLRLRFAGGRDPQIALDIVRTELAVRREQERTRIPFDPTALPEGAGDDEASWQWEWFRTTNERGHYMVRALLAWLEATEMRLSATVEARRASAGAGRPEPLGGGRDTPAATTPPPPRAYADRADDADGPEVRPPPGGAPVVIEAPS